jgi:hypothetical protein
LRAELAAAALKAGAPDDPRELLADGMPDEATLSEMPGWAAEVLRTWRAANPR